MKKGEMQMDGMESDDKQVYDKKFLLPGQIIIAKKPVLITTVLGSCVAVCLWDEKLRYGGMNHFMIPSWTNEKKPSAKYGDFAINKLLNKMLSFGSEKRNLRAKIFGGAENLNEVISCFDTGTKNTLLAITMLESQNIPVIAKNTGGNFGRNIKFFTDSGKVLMKLIPKSKIDFESGLTDKL
jgi:chemotaxis protein CheD